jgi:hypothetical protein
VWCGGSRTAAGADHRSAAHALQGISRKSSPEPCVGDQLPATAPAAVAVAAAWAGGAASGSSHQHNHNTSPQRTPAFPPPPLCLPLPLSPTASPGCCCRPCRSCPRHRVKHAGEAAGVTQRLGAAAPWITVLHGGEEGRRAVSVNVQDSMAETSTDHRGEPNPPPQHRLDSIPWDWQLHSTLCSLSISLPISPPTHPANPPPHTHTHKTHTHQPTHTPPTHPSPFTPRPCSLAHPQQPTPKGSTPSPSSTHSRHSTHPSPPPYPSTPQHHHPP